MHGMDNETDLTFVDEQE